MEPIAEIVPTFAEIKSDSILVCYAASSLIFSEAYANSVVLLVTIFPLKVCTIYCFMTGSSLDNCRVCPKSFLTSSIFDVVRGLKGIPLALLRLLPLLFQLFVFILMNAESPPVSCAIGCCCWSF